MTDNHIHFGQFYETYYEPLEIMNVIENAGIDSCWYSSTTSCKENIRYGEVEKEIELVTARFSTENFKPFLWYVPEYRKQGVAVENAMLNIHYAGIKLHPRSNSWDIDNFEIIDLLHSIFNYANANDLPVLIHTGYDKLDEANKFSEFFGKYPRTKIILAHCRPIEQTLELLQNYNNIFCDTAFVPEKDLQKIIANGFCKKIYLGSDFPITHYFEQNKTKMEIKLVEQYKKDIIILKKYKAFIEKDCGIN
jgi:predicted TIM-barrel fold metal-dependent hydrolase